MRSSFPIVVLGKHLKEYSFRNRHVVDAEVFSVTNTEGFTRSTDYFNKEVFSKDVSNYKIVERGQFAYNPSRINVGSIDYLKQSNRVLVSPLYIVFGTDEKLYPDYLLRYLQSDWGNAQIRANTEGAVRDSLKFSGLKNISIPLPEVNDQIRIASLLSQVEGLISKRKEHLLALDELLKSVFFEMFEISAHEKQQQNIKQLSQLSEIVSGVTKGKKYKNNHLIEVPYMRVANVQDGYLDLNEIKTIEVSQEEVNAYRLIKGDILLTEGGDPDKLGRGAVWDEQIKNCIHQNHIFRVRINNLEEINPCYLSALISSIYSKAYFLKSAKQTTGIASINSTQLKKFPVIVPPINLQNQFAAIVTKVESLKSCYQQSLADLETLYAALSQKAFKGELDLSRVPLPEITSAPTQEIRILNPEDQNGNAVMGTPTVLKSLRGLSDNEERKERLKEWLESDFVWFEGEELSVEDFFEIVLDRLYSGEEDISSWSSGLYDIVKEWLFEALEDRRFIQTYDETTKRIVLTRGKQNKK